MTWPSIQFASEMLRQRISGLVYITREELVKSA